MERVLAAARLHLINPRVTQGMPWLVGGVSFVINVLIWNMTPAGEAEGGFTGGVLALYFTVTAAYVQAVTQLLPFAMGISLSRRAFYLGTTLVAVVQSLVFGFVVSILVVLERATGGWGAGMQFWAPGPFQVDNVALQVLVSGAPALALMFVGVGIGVTQKRWGPTGVWTAMIGVLLLFGGCAVLVTGMNAWSTIARWSADQSIVTLTVALPLALTVALAAVGYAGIRRVVP
jgi:hypothetical protein